VTAVADERTNAVVVSAPDELMPTIESLIEQVDQSADVLTEVRVFPLQYADAEKLAEVVTSVFNGTTGSSNASRTQTSTFRQRFFGPMGMMAPPGAASGNSRAGSTNNDLCSRQQAAATITAVADTRTNSLVVSAVPDTMEQVRQVIEQLDKDPAKTKRVYTFTIQNADTEESRIFSRACSARAALRPQAQPAPRKPAPRGQRKWRAHIHRLPLFFERLLPVIAPNRFYD
jgi:type II secretory pathway component HofQ